MIDDAFETFGMAPRFDLKAAALEARHRELSRALHPDRFAGAPAVQRRRALNEAITVNQAHRHLKDPLQRAQLLAARVRRALNLPEQAEAPKPSPAFLMDVMELREQLADARHGRDWSRARTLGDSMGRRERELLGQLAQAFDAGVLAQVIASPDLPGEQPSGVNSEQARAVLAQAEALAGELRYVRRFLDEVAVMEDELDDVSSG